MEKEVKKDRYVLVQVPKEYGGAIQDNEEKDENGNPVLLDLNEVILEIANKVDKIQKAVAD
jgi:hypothetical protein